MAGLVDGLFGVVGTVVVEWLLIAAGRITLRIVSLGRLDGSDDACLWRREGSRLRMGFLFTTLTSVATWIAAVRAAATILDRHTPG